DAASGFGRPVARVRSGVHAVRPPAQARARRSEGAPRSLGFARRAGRSAFAAAPSQEAASAPIALGKSDRGPADPTLLPFCGGSDPAVEADRRCSRARSMLVCAVMQTRTLFIAALAAASCGKTDDTRKAVEPAPLTKEPAAKQPLSPALFGKAPAPLGPLAK